MEVTHRPPSTAVNWIRYHKLNGGHSIVLVNMCVCVAGVCVSVHEGRWSGCWEFGLPVENRIISTNPHAEAGLSHNLSTQVWEMHPFCQMSS